MATSKWKKVKVKVKGKMVERWTDGKSFRVAEPNGQGLTKAVQSTHKVGTYNVGRTKKWDGSKWVPVNVTHAGQKATLNGKPVIADGKGNWVTAKPNSLSGHGKKQGTYKKGDKSAPKPVGRNWSKPHGQVSDKPSTGDHTSARSSSPSTSSGSTSSRATSVSSSRSTSARTPQSKEMDANYKAWAKAHPELAKKVRKGQAGYDAINGTSSSSSTSGVGPVKDGDAYAESVEGSKRSTNRSADWLRDNFKPNGSDARSGVRQGIRAGQSADKSNQRSQAEKHYKSGNHFSAYDGGSNVGHGSTKDFSPKKSLKQALAEITDAYKKKNKHRTDGYF